MHGSDFPSAKVLKINYQYRISSLIDPLVNVSLDMERQVSRLASQH